MKKIILLFWLLLSMQLLGMEVNGNYSNFLYYEAAMKSGSEVRITPDEGGKKGAVWSRNMFDLNEDFHFEYEIYLGTKGIKSYESLKRENPNLNMEARYIDANGNVDIGADGMAFAFKSSDYKNDNYGNAGQSIGYGGGNFPYSFGVKFDTYTNPYYDPEYDYAQDKIRSITKDHIAFIAKGKIGTTRNSGVDGGTSYKEVDEMEDGEWHKVSFDWDASAKRFTYTFRDGMKTYTDTYSGDIVKDYLGGKYAYFGFTSSTGQWMNEHKLRNVRVKGTIPTDDYKLDIKKEVVSGNNYKLGDTIKYRITIINPGSETLTNIKLKDGKDISDEALASDVTLERSIWPELKAGENLVTYGTKKVSQEDIDEGNVIRTAAVEAQKRDGEKLYAAAEATVYPSIVEGLEVNKVIVSGNNYTKAGDIITYSFTAKNTGTITLTDLSVSDLKIPGIVLNKTELAPGETTYGTGSYTVSQEDVDRGSVENTANFRAVKPDGSVIGKSSTAIATGVPTPDIKVHKTITTAGEFKYSKVGNKIAYSFTVKNTGNTTLTSVTVTDPKIPTGITLDKDTLAPGDTATGTGEYTVTQEDIDAGQVDNTATFTGTDPKGDKVAEEDSVTAKGQVTNDFTVTNTPVINDKDDSSVVNKYTKVGDIVTYTVTLKNTGNATLKDIVITDTNNTTAIPLDKTSLIPGDTATGTVTHKVTQADIDEGKILNPAHFNAKDSAGIALPQKEAPATVEGASAPDIEVHKTVTTAGQFKYSKVGDKIAYNFSVTNTGNTTLTAVTVTDPKIPAGIKLDKDTLAPGDTATGTGEYTVTQADIDAGQVINTATFTGTDPNKAKVTKEDSVTAKGQVTNDFAVTNTPVINDKDDSSVVNKYTKVGDIVTYTVTLKNTGNATLKDIVITDTNNTTAIPLDKTSLIPGDTATGTVTHKVTQADIDAGKILNPAHFNAKDSAGTALPQKEAPATVHGETAASIEVHKTITTAGEFKYSKVGDKIAYNFSVTNTGNTTLTAVTVTDPKIPAGIKLDKDTLAPGDTATGNGEYTVTQADINAGQVINTATFTGTDPNKAKVTKEDSVTAKGQVTNDFAVTNTPVINDKDDSSVVNKYTKVGDIVTYTVTLKNTGNATLKDIVITDTNNTTAIPLDKTSLIPGDTATGTVTHKVTQADIDAGKILNPAHFNAKDSAGTALPQKEAPATVEGASAPDIEVHKTVTTAGQFKYSKVGDKIAYNFSVTNTGNTTLTAVTVTDPKIPAGIKLDKDTLAPGDTATGNGEYTVTQADIDAGQVINTATFTGTDPNKAKVTKEDSVTAKGQVTNDFAVTNTPVINDKDDSSVVNKYTKVGDIVTYTVTLKNTGNATLKDIVITDTNNTTAIPLDKTSLIPGDTATGTVTHKVTQADIDAGKILNPAHFNAKDSAGTALPQKEAPATVEGASAPDIEVHKTVTTAGQFKYSKVGDKIAYNFSVTNTGNTTLTAVTVTDPKIPAGIKLDKDTLAPGDTATGNGEYTVTQADIDAGQVINTATFTGTDPNKAKVTKEDSVTAKGQVTNDFAVTNTPVINDKDDSSVVNKYTKVGDIVTYTVTLKNTGNATLKDIVITDTNNTTAIPLDKTSLIPGDTATGTVTHKVTQADIDAGKILNPAHFNAKDSAGTALPQKEAPATVEGASAPDIEVHKTVTTAGQFKYSKVGDKIAYNFSVTNTGNTTLTAVTVTDPKIPAGIKLDKDTLAPGDTATGNGEYTVTQADIDAGQVINTATFTGTDPNKAKVTKEDSVTAKGQVTNDFAVTNTPVINDKDDSSVVNKYTKVGDIVTYTVTLKNTGNATLKDIVITDTNNTTAIPLDKTSLIPGDTATGTVTHKVTQADIDAGKILNPAHFNAKDSAGTALPQKEAPATVEGASAPDIEVHKTVTTAGQFKYSKVGDKIAYNFSVTNTGNTTLTAVTVTDPKIPAGIKLDKDTLAPGDTATGNGEYTVTQADIDAGQVINTATFTGTDPNKAKVTKEDSVTAKGQVTNDFAVTNTPVINDKDDSSVVNKYTKVGDIVTYTVTLKNTGNATLKDIVITDTNNTTAIPLDKTSLIPGDTATGTVTHKVTQADIDAGKILNPAHFNAKDSAGTALPQKEAPATVHGETAASIEVHKTITTAGEFKYSKVGDKIAYNFSVTNTGNTTLTAVTVTDPKIPAGIKLDKDTLAPGDTATGNGEYTVTQADIDAGQVINTATFTGTDPNKAKVTKEDSVTAKGQVTNDFAVTNTPVINDKDDSSVVNKYTKVGDIVTYTVTLKNTGNATLKDIVITDTNNTTAIPLDKTSLIPGDTATGTVTHKVTQADIDAGKILNPAHFNAKDAAGTALPQKEAPVTVHGEAIIDLYIEKTVTDESGDGKAQNGEVLTYTITVKNNSNITIITPKLTDTLSSKFFHGEAPRNLSVKGANSQGSLKSGITLDRIAVGQSVEVSFQMKADYPAGTTSGDKVDNIAAISYGGKSIDSNKVSLPVEELSLTDLDIKLDVKDLGGNGTKKGDGVVEDGESAEYTISVTNKSSVDAENVRVIDPYKEIFLYKDKSYSYLSLENGRTSAKDLGEGIVLPRVKAGETVKLKFQVEFAYKGREVYEGDTIPNQAYLTFDQTKKEARSRSIFQISSFAAAPAQKKDSNVVVLNVADPSYTLTKTIRDNKTAFYPGDSVIYDIQLTNNSTVIGRDVKIQDRISQIKAFESWDWRRGEIKDTKSLLKAGVRRDLFETGLTINSGETKKYTLVGKLKNDLKKGDVTNIAEAGRNLEIKAEAKLKVEEADIKIEKIAKKRWVSIGDLVSYKIVIQNLSASESNVLKDVNVVDILPPGFKYADGSAKVDGKKINVENKGRTVYFKGLTLTGKKELEISYILRVGTGVKPGTYVNKAWTETSGDKKASKVAEAKVEVINDPLFNSTVIIGKVFHDRDGDGWQDDATAKEIKIKTLTNQANYSDGFIESNGEKWSIPPAGEEILVGDLTGKLSEDSTASTVRLKRGIIDPKAPGDIVVSTKKGTTITLKSSGEIIKSYGGEVKKGLSGEKVNVSRKIVKNPSYREGFKEVKGKRRVVLDNIFDPVYFDSAYALIKENESEKLKKYIENLQHKKNLKIILTGYTDSQHLTKRAKKRYRNNLDLSLARAEVLKEYLAAKLDIAEEMFVVEGRGSENPVASNWTNSGRELNRRSEISIEYDEEIMEKKKYKLDNSSYFEVIEIKNEGIREEGIPGVRLATVEGLVMETDRFGRFHVDGVDDIPDRGKNYIIKVDKATLPPDTLFTTENPRVKTLSKVMEKFNFGVKMPEMKKIKKEKVVEIRVGSVFFKTNKWEIKKDQIKNLNSIAALLKKHNGGRIIVEGNADSRASNEHNRILALKRAKTVQEELTKLLGEKEVSKVTIVSQLPGGEI